MIRAVGDSALIVDDGGMRLVDARGVVARWPGHVHTVLADPPRLAIGRPDGFVELVDVATGEPQRFIGRKLTPLAFSLDGAQLFGLDSAENVVIDERGDARDLAGVSVERIVVSRARRFAGIGFGRPRGTVVVDAGSSAAVPIGREASRPLSFSVDGACVATIEFAPRVGERAIAISDASNGRRLSRVIETSAQIVAVWTDRDLLDVAALDANKRVHRGRRGTLAARDHLGPHAHAQGPYLGDARVDCARGSSIVAGGRSIDACFTPSGACVGLREGRARVFAADDDDDRDVEGPTSLLAITPHPRGVLAVDDQDRAHVIAIDDEVSS